jgi:hypothetical protein
MTDREKEIRDAERKALAEVRQWRRNVAKRKAAMTPEELQKYQQKRTEELKAEGFSFIN